MHRKTDERRRKLYEIIAEICEIPADAVFSVPVFVLRGKHELEITGCTGVKEYTGERIVLALKKELFTVTGDMLELTDFSDSVLYIRGNIGAMKFGADGGDEGC